MHAGADFIKTSTGKIQPAATMQVTLVMLQAIRDYFYDTGRMVGMKPAGGISSAKLAIHYLVMLRETLGNAWMTPEWFRFGASSLANDVLMQIVKQETGVYQSADYFAFEGGWEYSPAPESTDHIKVAKRYELFIGGDFVKPESGKYFDTINPATEERLSRVAHANDADVDKAIKAARKAYNGPWSRMKAADRGKYIYRIARIIQERAREFAAIESLDGGKPIREARDVDIPLAAAHFFYYAGWADKLEYAFPGRKVRPMGVAGQIIPVELPAVDGRLEGCSRTGLRQYGRAETRGNDPVDRDEARRGHCRRGTSRGRRQYRYRRRRHRVEHRFAFRRGQNRIHGLDGSRPHHPESAGRQQKEVHARTRRQGGEHHFCGRGHRRGCRGHRQRHLFQPGARMLCRLAPVRTGIGGRPGDRQTKRSHGNPDRRRPARQEHGHRCDQFESTA
jgi:hypothetical protein